MKFRQKALLKQYMKKKKEKMPKITLKNVLSS